MPLWLIGVSLAHAGLTQCNNWQAAENSLQRIVNEWPLRGSGDHVSQYVQNLGLQLASKSGYRGPVQWRFAIVRNLAPNAFSIGSGYVFVTDGAVKFVQNESELAAILAHELGHELAGHFCAQASQNDGWLSSLFSYPGAKQNQVGVGSLTQVIDPAKEQQADSIALSLLWSGGYDPKALLAVAQRLPSNTALHQLNADRIQYLQQAVARFPPVNGQNSTEFLAVKRELDLEQ